jgi:uncharacterized protein
MKKSEYRFLKGSRMILWVLVAYLGILGVMYVFQRGLLFHPNSDNPFLKVEAPFKPFVYQTPVGLNLRGLWMPPKPGHPTIVYFHGNAGSLSNRIFKAKYFIARGYGIALVGYRGYSGNPGFPSEKNLYEDARSAIAAIHAHGVADRNMVLYGESLGTGVATQMATEMPAIKALVLEAPYTSIPDVAASHFWMFPVHSLIKDRFESAKKIGILKMPILVIHGTKDKTVPYKFGKKLFSLVTTKHREFVTLEGASHTDLYDFGAEEALHAFITKIQ